jgi:predicted RNA-binding protein with RPS1 domain
MSAVFLSCLTAYVIHLISGEEIATMTGVLFGAVTNTPGLGAAQQAFTDITGEVNANIASGYAMAYPLGVVGIILSLLAMRWFFRIKTEQEEARVAAESEALKEIEHIDVLLANPQVEGAHIRDLSALCNMNLIVSRLVRPDGEDELPDVDTVLHVGDRIRVIIKSIDPDSGRLFVTHKELLGTWEQNASLFEPGQTVAGIVRSIEDYGIFVELTPNLAGLAEYRRGMAVGQVAAVYIKNIIPDRMKLKLVLIDSYRGEGKPSRSVMGYSPDITHVDAWRYSPTSCSRIIETVFQ